MPRYTGPDLGTVLRVLDRDGHACIRCATAIRGDRGGDWVIHHRRPRGIGGSRREDTNLPSNLLSLCAPCHNHIESDRAEALENGWLLHQGVDPPSVAVLVEHGSRWVYLNNASEYIEHPPERTERPCGCGHAWDEHEAFTQFQNDQPVVVGRGRCRGETAPNAGLWRAGAWKCRCPEPFDNPVGVS